MILVLDTATRTPVVAVARPDGTLVADRRWSSRHRHGEELLQRIDEVLAEASVGRRDLSAVVVGTGPGSFTGLRIGLATAKTIAYALSAPIVGVSTTVALALADGAEGEVVVTLPAGASDRYIHRLGGRKSQPQVRGGLEVEADAIAIDFEAGKVPAAALERGEAALSRLGSALASLGAEALAAGAIEEVDRLVPAYVALPRGIARAAAEDDMVARPPVRITVEPMTLDDVPDVHRIEASSFPVPWPDYAFRQELQTNRMAHYMVVRAGAETVAYGGMWLMVDEAHITTFAVTPEWRRRGIGGRLMLEMMGLAQQLGARVATLEVRLSNRAARALYGRFGFRPVGVRPRYYSDNGEDALIMTTSELDSAEMAQRLTTLAQAYGDGVMEEPAE